MSSLPGTDLEAFVGWQWGLRVEDQPENNQSLWIAEAMGVQTNRLTLSPAQFAILIRLYEPYREDIERKLECFDEDSMSWRDYAGSLDWEPEAVYQAAKTLVETFKSAVRLQAQRDHFANLLRQCKPVMVSHARASHLTEGFRPRLNRWDSLADEIQAALRELDGPSADA